MAIQAIICDVDGTLIDSNDAHARAFVQAFADNGIDVSFDKIRRLIGKGGDKVLAEVANVDSESPQGKTIKERRKEIYLQQYVPSLQPTPGAKEFLDHLRQANIKIVAATSGEEDTDEALKTVGLLDYFEVKATSKDAPNSKPDPDIVQAALNQAGLQPDQAVMLGDTPYDAQAAGKAGLRTIGLMSGGWQADDLTEAGAMAVYANPADLLAHFEEALGK